MKLRKIRFLFRSIFCLLLIHSDEARGQGGYYINLKSDIQNLEFNTYSIRFIPVDSVFDSNGNIRSHILDELNNLSLKRLKGAYFHFKIGYFQADTNSKKRNELAFSNFKTYFKRNKAKCTSLVDLNCQDVLAINSKAKEYEQRVKSTLTNSIFLSIYKSREKAPRSKSKPNCYL